MEHAHDRRGTDARLAVLEECIEQLEKRCDKKDAKIEALQAFQNKLIGYAMGASMAVSAIVNFFLQ